MNVKKYIKRPIAIEALQWTGDNIEEITAFANKDVISLRGGSLYVKTLEGNMLATIGSYVIKGVDGEFYPCREDIFERTYEQV